MPKARNFTWKQLVGSKTQSTDLATAESGQRTYYDGKTDGGQRFSPYYDFTLDSHPPDMEFTVGETGASEEAQKRYYESLGTEKSLAPDMVVTLDEVDASNQSDMEFSIEEVEAAEAAQKKYYDGKGDGRQFPPYHDMEFTLEEIEAYNKPDMEFTLEETEAARKPDMEFTLEETEASGGVVNEKIPLSQVLNPPMKRLEISEVSRLGDPQFTLNVLSNPTEFEDSIETEWTRFSAQGGGYSRMHFVTSKNRIIEMDLHWHVREDATDSTKGKGKDNRRIDQSELCAAARDLLLSWNYPDYTEDGWSLGPPQLVLNWPPVIVDYRCYLIDCRIRNLKFSADGRVLRWIASVKFEQATTFFRPPATDVSGMQTTASVDLQEPVPAPRRRKKLKLIKGVRDPAVYPM